MVVEGFVWLDDVVEKIGYKHHVSQDEVEEVFYNRPKYKKAQKGKFKGEDLYYAYGRTDVGRYLFIVFIYKRTRDALIVSARDMNAKERKGYAKK